MSLMTRPRVRWGPPPKHHCSFGLLVVLVLSTIVAGVALTGPLSASSPGSVPRQTPVRQVSSELRIEPILFHQVAPSGPASESFLVDSVNVGAFPTATALDSANGYIYVPNAGSSNVSIIDGTSLLGTVPVDYGPASAVFDPSNGYVYVLDTGPGPVGPANVSVISGMSVVASIPLPPTEDLGMLVVDPSNGYVYALNSGSVYSHGWSNVSVIDGTSLIASIRLGLDPSAAVFDPIDGDLYVSNGYSGNVSVITGTSVIAAIRLSPPTYDEYVALSSPVFDSETGFVYVSSGNTTAGNISVLSGASLRETFTIGSLSGPGILVPDLSNGDLDLLGCDGLCNALVIKGTSVIATIALSPGFVGGFYDPANGYLYVTNPSNYIGNLTVINGSYVVRSIPLGQSPIEGTYDPTNGNLYVANTNSNNISVINGTAYFSPLPLTASATASETQTDVNQPIHFIVSGFGGARPYSFFWQFGNGNTTAAQDPVYSYPSPGTYVVRVQVNDFLGVSASATLSVTVYPTFTTALAVSNTTVALGMSLVVSTSVAGGAGPYSFLYEGLPPGCVSVNASSVACLPTQTGFYNLSVTVQDRNNVVSSASTPLEVIFDFGVSAPSQDSPGHPFTIAITPYGGTAPFVYSYGGLPAGCTSVNEPQLTCTPNATGSYLINVTVQDQAGHHASHVVRLSVAAPVAGLNLFFLQWPFLLWIPALVAVVVMALLAVPRRGAPAVARSGLYQAYDLPRGGNQFRHSLPSGGSAASEHEDTVTEERVSEAKNTDSFSDLI